METNIEVYSKNDKKINCCCLWIVLGMVIAVLTFFIGLLVAATTGILTSLGTAAIIALVIILSVLLVIAIINVLCCKTMDQKKKYCC